ncbi:helix-turn-helix domain-containing protein [Vibrio maritimus]|uniref:helix-turn-helix domain-containing protein n=1 Tax=Vibrio maritimus TaxID=990268 RepID=UPI001F17B9EC|nr:helix-turn-helix transcriptional regulator [Vibrio maritimus]
MGRKAAHYDPVVLQKIRSSWDDYKQATGMSQAKAAEALGMNQSAFSQYLRGSVPLNVSFIAKFARLVNQEPTFFDEDLAMMGYQGRIIPAPAVIQVTHKLSGEVYDPPKSVAISGHYTYEDRVAIEIDKPYYAYKEGMLMICDTTTTLCRETTEVALFDSNKQIKAMGELAHLDDDSWAVNMIFQGKVTYVPIVDSDYVFKVIGGYYLEPSYKKVFTQPAKEW